MGTITCYTRTSQIPNITSSLIYTQCNDILSNKGLRRKLNPISIKLEQMSNFPYDIVIKSGFNYLYAKIMFVDQTIMTPYYIPTRTIYFEFMKCFLNEEFQATELISFLGTKLLTVEIIGIRRKNVAKPLVSVSQKPGTKKSVKEPDTHEKEDVLLCFASFDVSDLLRGLWEVRLIGSVSQPNNMHCVSINDNNAENDQKNSPLTNDILTLFGTTIKIKVHVACDLHVVEEATKNILTGFAIDANDQYYIFLEGLANGYLLKIWEKIAKLSNEEGYVFYNSTCVFLTRLYTDFMPLGGFLTLKLSESLETELLHHGLYIGKTGKTFRANVLRTIGLMKLTSTMTSLSQKCLLPNTTAVKYLFHEIGKHYFENFALKSEE
ncbi:hypothetical protein WN55_07152 [Dufourea novaeangliae]|uniref:Uncharacterized protein n=1 Tax=Dufourea novaeangliae TaxID=178035 RepID=A0A154P2A7_DUFNO|nr:hypothetical protein WN55_07152 [Dufourea novaeangliae]